MQLFVEAIQPGESQADSWLQYDCVPVQHHGRDLSISCPTLGPLASVRLVTSSTLYGRVRCSSPRSCSSDFREGRFFNHEAPVFRVSVVFNRSN